MKKQYGERRRLLRCHNGLYYEFRCLDKNAVSLLRKRSEEKITKLCLIFEKKGNNSVGKYLRKVGLRGMESFSYTYHSGVNNRIPDGEV